MKKTVKILAVAMAALLCLAALAACGKTISGTYKSSGDIAGLAGASVTYKFSGKNVVISTTANVLGFEKTTDQEATYSIATAEDGKVTITFTTTAEDGSTEQNTYSFAEGTENGVKYISIGGVKYTKQ